jgi:hypothetical protein
VVRCGDEICRRAWELQPSPELTARRKRPGSSCVGESPLPGIADHHPDNLDLPPAKIGRMLSADEAERLLTKLKARKPDVERPRQPKK